jgi:cytochrome c-type biogenesis protein
MIHEPYRSVDNFTMMTFKMMTFKRKRYILVFYLSLLFSITLAFTPVGNDNVLAVYGQPTPTPLKEQLKAAPEYCASTLDRKISCLEDYRGKPILVNVWATWCIPCRQEMPALEALYKEYSNKGFIVIGVSVDSPGSENRIKTFADMMGITYTILHDPDDQFASAFRTIGVPESYLINHLGEIAHTWKGPFDATSADTKGRVESVLYESNPDSRVANSSSVSGEPKPDAAINMAQKSTSNLETIGYPVAFVAGILSFLSPCILPLIPSYVAFITGMSMDELTNKKTRGLKGGNEKVSTTSRYSPDSPNEKRWDNISLDNDRTNSSTSKLATVHTKNTAIFRGLLFIAGFSVVFISLDASITALGSAFSDYGIWIERIGGILLVIFGLHLLGVLRIPGSEREWGFRFSKRPIAGHIGSFVIGMGFGAGWTPCIGPILASILTIAASSTSLFTGVNLLAVYSAGLAIPFVISTIAIEKFMIAFKKYKKWLPWVNRASAILLIVVGIILLTGMLTILTGTLTSIGYPMG